MKFIKERYYFENVSSTNVTATEYAKKGCGHGTLILADAQEAGKGRLGRSWFSEKGTGIYMSLVLRPDLKPEDAPGLTLVAALSVAKAIEKVTGTVSTPALQIKWPNDVVIDKKKVCGILTEMNLKGSEIDFVIVGIGINVHQKQFSKEILDVATSLDLITGEENSREELTEAVLEAFEICYKQYIKTGNLEYLKQEYEHYLANKDSQVKVLDPAGSYEGIAKGITNKGELIVDTGHEICYVSSGEVSVRGIYGYV